MITRNQDSPLELCSMGEVALRLLSNAQHGSVLASVTHANYLLSSMGELCWLIPKGSPMHQRGMEVAGCLPRMKVGRKYAVADHTLSICSGENLDFHNHSIWISPSLTSTGLVSRSRLSEYIPAFVDKLLTLHTPFGLGGLISPILQVTSHQNKAVKECLTEGIIRKAWPAIKGTILASMTTDTQAIIDNAQHLIGLGEGLTPSGDDFLGGFFFSRWLLSHYYPDILIDEPFSTYSDFITQSKPLTNLISYTFLKDHLDGHSVEPLHQLANGLLQGETTESLVLYTERLISLGHTTGWDLMTGFLAGMFVTFTQ